MKALAIASASASERCCAMPDNKDADNNINERNIFFI
jgi:hypothetical protein